ncbi:MAG: DoxX family protein [Myxococcaceae bacterium]|nr:DoxX family protein [Myxococcaceae bacterium]MCI0673906.1 DoxX family protein [Myxococcaceae bacterium]
MWAWLNRWNADLGLLMMRVGLGLAFLFVHGAPKLMGGPERWAKLGGALGNFGIDFAPTFWGLLAAVSEFGGALCLLTGVLFRPALAGLIVTMAVATSVHLARGEGFGGASHALEVGIAFIGLFLTGPGRYRLRLPWPSRPAPLSVQ